MWKGEVAVTGEQGQRTTTVFPLGAVLKTLKPGGYVIKAKDASGGRTAEEDDNNRPAQASRWVMFTDMALIAYQGSDGLDAVVRSLKTAKTLAGVRVVLVAQDGEDLASGATDSSGRVRFPGPLLKGKDASHAKMLMAYGPQADLAVLDLDRSPVDLSNQGIGGRARPRRPHRPAARPRPPSTAISTPTGASIGRARPCTWSPWCATAPARR